jgi:hypothetical protein
MSQIYYDRQGSPTAYSEDKKTIYLFSGRPVAYIQGGSIYSFHGKHLGILAKGWVRDNEGFCVFYTPKAVRAGAPPKPVTRAVPAKNDKKAAPAKGLRQRKSTEPVSRRSWSQSSGTQFFEL